VGVGVVGLAALPGGVDPHTRRQFRRYVYDLLTGVEQPQHQVLADALTALHRPHPVLPRRRTGEHRFETGWASPETATPKHLLLRAHRLDRGRPLVRVHSDHHAAHVVHAFPLPPVMAQ
jgi:hypothetical protein